MDNSLGRLDSFANSNQAIEKLHSLLLLPGTSEKTRCCRIAHIFAKVFVSGACFFSSFSNMESTKRNFDNVILQNIFAIAEAITWGGLSVYSVNELYDNLVNRDNHGSIKKLRSCALLAHCLSIVVLGLLSVAPSAYTSYFYNTNIFWCIYTPIINSFFGMNSVNKFLQKMYKPNSLIRKPCLTKLDCQLAITHENFCKLIKYSHQSIEQNMDKLFSYQIKFIESTNDQKIVQCNKFILEILQKGLTHIQSDIKRKPNYYINAKTSTKVISSILYAGSPIVDAILVYKGFHLIINQNWPIPFIILFSVGPGIYLELKFSQKFYQKLLDKAIEVPKKCCRLNRCRNYNYKEISLKISILCSILFLTSLSLGSDITVARDNIGFKFPYALISISSIATMAILLMVSMHSMADRALNFYKERKKPAQELELSSKLKKIESFFKSLTPRDMNTLMLELELSESIITMLSEKDFIDMRFPEELLSINDVLSTDLEE